MHLPTKPGIAKNLSNRKHLNQKSFKHEPVPWNDTFLFMSSQQTPLTATTVTVLERTSPADQQRLSEVSTYK